jgi:hypothetical protein
LTTLGLLTLVFVAAFSGLQLFCWAMHRPGYRTQTLVLLRRLAESRTLSINRNALVFCFFLGAALAFSKRLGLEREAVIAVIGYETFLICSTQYDRKHTSRK